MPTSVMPSNDDQSESEPSIQTTEGGIDIPLDADVTNQDNSGWVVAALESRREEILSRWVEIAGQQPFHEQRKDHAVSDHIPQLFDAVLEFLRKASDSPERNTPLEDPAVLQAAQMHARVRTEQGLQPADIVVEFRVLRREIGRALTLAISDRSPTSDVISAHLLVNDALDGAISIGLDAITRRIEEVREDFLVSTVHEVRQPITNIKGIAQIAHRALEQEQPDTERLQHGIERINAEADRMSTLLSQLIEVSRASLGHLDLQPDEVSLASVTQLAIDRLKPGDHRRITVDLPVDEEITGYWDSDRLAQVFTNLLSNAVKYSPSETPVELKAEKADGFVHIMVRDSGIGIDPDDIHKLFQRYYRTDSAIQQGVEGMGYGLFLCRHIVEAHGGEIWAESEGRDRGTVFHINLPQRVTMSQPSE